MWNSDLTGRPVFYLARLLNDMFNKKDESTGYGSCCLSRALLLGVEGGGIRLVVWWPEDKRAGWINFSPFTLRQCCYVRDRAALRCDKVKSEKGPPSLSQTAPDSFTWKCQDTKGREKGSLCLFFPVQWSSLPKVLLAGLSAPCLKAESLTCVNRHGWLRGGTTEQRRGCAALELCRECSALYSRGVLSWFYLSWAAASKMQLDLPSAQANYDLHPWNPF